MTFVNVLTISAMTEGMEATVVAHEDDAGGLSDCSVKMSDGEEDIDEL